MFHRWYWMFYICSMLAVKAGVTRCLGWYAGLPTALWGPRLGQIQKVGPIL